MVYDRESLDEYLSHHQIEGAKHGVRNGPPYPLQPAQMTATQKKNNKELLAKKEKLLKKREKYQNAIEKKEAKLKAKQLKKDEKINKKKSKNPEPLKPLSSEEKDSLIRNNNVRAIYAHRSEFSTDELNNVIYRYSKETELKKISESATKDIWSKMENASKKIDKIQGFTKSAINLYNTIAPAINSATDAELKRISFDTPKNNQNQNNGGNKNSNNNNNNDNDKKKKQQ